MTEAHQPPDVPEQDVRHLVVTPGQDTERHVLRMAALLVRMGLEPGDRVLIRAENSRALVVTLIALVHLDCSLVLVDPLAVPEDVRAMARRARARWTLEDEQAVTEAHSLRLADLHAVAGTVPALPGPVRHDRWAERTDALVMWSSGTTGSPKAIVKRGSAVLANCRRSIDVLGYTPDDRLLPLLPFSHQYGFSLVVIWWLTGCSLVLASSRRTDRALAEALAAGAGVVDSTPPVFHSVLRFLEKDPELLAAARKVRMWCVGGAPLPQPLARDFLGTLGAPLLDGYGATETGNIALATASDPVGCGRPLPGVAVRVMAPDGRELPPGATGSVEVSTPDLMSGLLADDGTVEPYRESWYRTGDIGTVDEAGRLHVHGRDRAVHRMGYTLYPEEIERRAERCGAPVRVLTCSHPRRGADLLFVVLDPSGGDPADWHRVLRRLLPRYEQPNQVAVVPEFPLTGNGKVDTEALRGCFDAPSPHAPSPAPPSLAPPSLAPPSPPRTVRSDRRSPHMNLAPAHPERAAALDRVREALSAPDPAVLAVLTEISSVNSARYEVDAARRTLLGAVAEVTRHAPPRLRSAAVYMPSNVILYSYILYLLVPALYTDRLSFRPSRHVKEQTARIHALLQPVHGLPVELCDLSQRAFLEQEVDRADVVLFTGRYGNAEQIRPRLRPDQLLLFFGMGVNPFVVTQDADLPAAARDLADIRLFNTGQDCLAPDAVFVHDDVAAPFLDALRAELDARRYGPYHDPGADYGPLYYEEAFEEAVAFLTRWRRDIMHGGGIDAGPLRVEPTVVVRDDLSLARSVPEFFAPVFNVFRYQEDRDLKELFTSNQYSERAMGASVYGSPGPVATYLERKHTVTRNQTLVAVDDGNQPFGGRGRMANYASFRRSVHAEPILVSKATADHFRPAEVTG